MQKEQNTRKRKTGIVCKNAMDKTALVEVSRMVLNPMYKKYIRRKNKFMVHDEKNECKLGDLVELEECRPLSKRKSWRMVKILKHEEAPKALELDEVEKSALAEKEKKEEQTADDF